MSWSSLYANPQPLDAAFGHRRIFAPESYDLVRTRQVVPIVEAEAFAMAAFFPVCWQMQDDEATLCVVRSLLADGRGHPVPALHVSRGLPHVLRAFPLAQIETENPADIFIDDVPPDRPTDLGAPIRAPDGSPSLGALQRVRMILALRQQAESTRRLGAALVAADLLEPWPLDFALNETGRRVRLDGLMAIRPRELGQHAAGILREFGATAAMLVTLHRLSLFRISTLIRAARSATAEDEAESLTESAA